MKYTKYIIPLLTISWIVLFVFLNFVPYLVGRSLTPTWSVFLGTVFYSMDYLYYLTFMAEGETHWFLSSHLQTPEKIPQSMIGWTYVLMGKLSYLFHVPHIIGFQIAIVIFSFIFLIASYVLLLKIFSNDKLKAFFAFILFTTANSLPILTKQKGNWIVDVYHPWYNWGQPFTRFSNIPHHLIIQCAILGICLTFLAWIRAKQVPFFSKNKIVYAGIFIGLGFVLGSTQPIQLGIVVASLGLLQLTSLRKINKKEIIETFLPILFIFLGAVGPAIHLQQTSKIPLYALAAAWEGNQHMPNSIADFLRLQGFIIITGIIGAIFAWKKQGKLGQLLFIMTAISLLLFFTDIPQHIRISNVRFLSSIPTLYFSFTTVLLFSLFAEKFTRVKVVILTILVALFVIPTLPATYAQMTQRTSEFITNNAYQYLHIHVYQIFEYAKKISTEDDVFLVTWPFNLAFPAVTGRRVFYTNFLATYEFDKKEWLTGSFFSGELAVDDVKEMFKTYKIKYIIGFIPPKYSSLPIKTLQRNEVTAISEVQAY